MPTHPQPPADLLSVKEVAKRLGVHERTVRRLIWSGRLRAITVGRLLRIDPAEVADYARRCAYSRDFV